MQQFKKPTLLFVLLIILIALISWQIYPQWKNTPGGVIALLVVVFLSLWAIIKDLPGFLLDLRKLQKSDKEISVEDIAKAIIQWETNSRIKQIEEQIEKNREVINSTNSISKDEIDAIKKDIEQKDAEIEALHSKAKDVRSLFISEEFMNFLSGMAWSIDEVISEFANELIDYDETIIGQTAMTNAGSYYLVDLSMTSFEYIQDGIVFEAYVQYEGEQDPERVYWGEQVEATIKFTIILYEGNWKVEDYEVKSANVVVPE
jgi:archaellum component FlaC